MAEYTKIAHTSDVLPGAGTVAEINEHAIALFNLDGTFYAIDNTCIHRGGPLGEGELEGDCVTCPWHNWEYNVKTGACLTNPAAKVKTYDVKIEGDEVKILLDNNKS